MDTRAAAQTSQLTNPPANHPALLRQEILDKVAEYYRRAHAGRPFVPGQTRVQYAGRVFDEAELMNGVEAVLDFWLTLGRFGQEFERRLCQFIGVRSALLVNSGSSANLV